MVTKIPKSRARAFKSLPDTNPLGMNRCLWSVCLAFRGGRSCQSVLSLAWMTCLQAGTFGVFALAVRSQPGGGVFILASIAIGILMDAFLVRSLLVPATVAARPLELVAIQLRHTQRSHPRTRANTSTRPLTKISRGGMEARLHPAKDAHPLDAALS